MVDIPNLGGWCGHPWRTRQSTWHQALYVSLKLETALAEYRQLDTLLPPGLMVSYSINIDAIADFRGGYTGDWEPIWQDFYCDCVDLLELLTQPQAQICTAGRPATWCIDHPFTGFSSSKAGQS